MDGYQQYAARQRAQKAAKAQAKQQAAAAQNQSGRVKTLSDFSAEAKSRGVNKRARGGFGGSFGGSMLEGISEAAEWMEASAAGDVEGEQNKSAGDDDDEFAELWKEVEEASLVEVGGEQAGGEKKREKPFAPADRVVSTTSLDTSASKTPSYLAEYEKRRKMAADGVHVRAPPVVQQPPAATASATPQVAGSMQAADEESSSSSSSAPSPSEEIEVQPKEPPQKTIPQPIPKAEPIPKAGAATTSTPTSTSATQALRAVKMEGLLSVDHEEGEDVTDPPLLVPTIHIGSDGSDTGSPTSLSVSPHQGNNGFATTSDFLKTMQLPEGINAREAAQQLEREDLLNANPALKSADPASNGQATTFERFDVSDDDSTSSEEDEEDAQTVPKVRVDLNSTNNSDNCVEDEREAAEVEDDSDGDGAIERFDGAETAASPTAPVFAAEGGGAVPSQKSASPAAVLSQKSASPAAVLSQKSASPVAALSQKSASPAAQKSPVVLDSRPVSPHVDLHEHESASPAAFGDESSGAEIMKEAPAPGPLPEAVEDDSSSSEGEIEVFQPPPPEQIEATSSASRPLLGLDDSEEAAPADLESPWPDLSEPSPDLARGHKPFSPEKTPTAGRKSPAQAGSAASPSSAQAAPIVRSPTPANADEAAACPKERDRGEDVNRSVKEQVETSSSSGSRSHSAEKGSQNEDEVVPEDRFYRILDSSSPAGKFKLPEEQKRGNVANVLAAFQMGIDEIEGSTADQDQVPEQALASSESPINGLPEEDTFDDTEGGNAGRADSPAAGRGPPPEQEELPLAPSISAPEDADAENKTTKPSLLEEFDIDDDLEAFYAAQTKVVAGSTSKASSSTTTTTTGRKYAPKGGATATHSPSGLTVGMRGLLSLNHGEKENVGEGAQSPGSGPNKDEFIMSSKPTGKSHFVARQDPFEAALRQKAAKAATAKKSASSRVEIADQKQTRGEGHTGDAAAGVDSIDVESGNTVEDALEEQSGAEQSAATMRGSRGADSPSAAATATSAAQKLSDASSVLGQYRRPDLKQSLERLEEEIKGAAEDKEPVGRAKTPAPEGEATDGFPTADTQVKSLEQLEAEEREIWAVLEKEKPKAKTVGIQPKTDDANVSHHEFLNDFFKQLPSSGDEEEGQIINSSRGGTSRASGGSASSSLACCLGVLNPSSAVLESADCRRVQLLATNKQYGDFMGDETSSKLTETQKRVLVRSLNTIYKKLASSPTAPLLVDSRWEVIGFQNTDPRMDLNRSNGVLNVYHLFHLIVTDFALAENLFLLSQDPVQQFPLFCTSIAFSKLVLDIMFRDSSAGEKGVSDPFRSARGKLHRWLRAEKVDNTGSGGVFRVGGVLEGLAEVQNAMLHCFYQRWQSEVLSIGSFGRVYKDIEKQAAKNPTSFVATYHEYQEGVRRATDPSRLEFTDLDAGSRNRGSAAGMSRAEEQRLKQYAA